MPLAYSIGHTKRVTYASFSESLIMQTELELLTFTIIESLADRWSDGYLWFIGRLHLIYCFSYLLRVIWAHLEDMDILEWINSLELQVR